MLRVLGVLLRGLTTLGGIAIGLWLWGAALDAWLLDSWGWFAIPLIAPFELVFGGIGLYLGYRVYFRLSA